MSPRPQLTEQEVDNLTARFAQSVTDLALNMGIWHGPQPAYVLPHALTAVLASFIGTNMKREGHADCIALVNRQLTAQVDKTFAVLTLIDQLGPEETARRTGLQIIACGPDAERPAADKLN